MCLLIFLGTLACHLLALLISLVHLHIVVEASMVVGIGMGAKVAQEKVTAIETVIKRGTYMEKKSLI